MIDFEYAINELVEFKRNHRWYTGKIVSYAASGNCILFYCIQDEHKKHRNILYENIKRSRIKKHVNDMQEIT